MDRPIIERLAQSLRDYYRHPSNQRTYTITEPYPEGQIQGWYNNDKEREAAFLVRVTDTGDEWTLLLADWRQDGNWYVVLCTDPRRGPICELQRSVEGATHPTFRWRYAPRKQDVPNNDARREYFIAHYGAIEAEIPVPLDRSTVEDFLDRLIELGDYRIAADNLDNEFRAIRNVEFREGREIETRHKTRERSLRLIREAKARVMALEGCLRCECCKFDFVEKYGELGTDFIEAHHAKSPVSDLSREGETTRVEDIALVCPNCHRMLHRRRPWLERHELHLLIPES